MKSGWSKLHVCSFSVGIDEVPKRAVDYESQVVSILKEKKRFSAFEASDHPKIAKLMTRLCAEGGRVETDNSTGYPWTRVVSIDGVPV